MKMIRMMRMTHRARRLLAWMLVLAAAVAAAALVVRQQFLGNAVRAERSLYVSGDTGYAALCDSLAPVLRHRGAFRLYARRLGLEQGVRPGHYLLRPGMSVVEVVRTVKLGLQTPVRVTLHGARTRAQLAAKLSRQLEADSAAWMAAFTSPGLAREAGFDSLTLFSMFLPNTYEFYWTVSPRDFVLRMRREYDRFWTPERDAKCRRIGLSRLEVTTLASIVAEETRRTDEMPRIAGVYMNRLRRGMPLQADPTVKYALQDFALRRILHRHLKYPSPYNTYLHRGLPPSPICMPPLAAVDAVLDYERHDYLFFCARPSFDGYHDFARTYGEHLRNARAYSAELNRRNIR